MLNKAHMIEITKACIVAFIKARNSLMFDVVERKKKQKIVKMYFLKLTVKFFC